MPRCAIPAPEFQFFGRGGFVSYKSAERSSRWRTFQHDVAGGFWRPDCCAAWLRPGFAMTVTEEGTIWQATTVWPFGGEIRRARLRPQHRRRFRGLPISGRDLQRRKPTSIAPRQQRLYSIFGDRQWRDPELTTDATAPTGGQSYSANFLTSGIPGFWDETINTVMGATLKGTAIIAQNAIYSYLNSMGTRLPRFCPGFFPTPLADDYQHAFSRLRRVRPAPPSEVRGGRFARESGWWRRRGG